MLSDFKVIFFDAGGTLFRPYPSVGEIYQEVAGRHGCIVEADFIENQFHEAWLKRDGLAELASHSSEKIERAWWRDLVHEVFTHAGGLKDFENFFDELYDLFAQPQVWQLYPGTLEVLKHLKKEKKQLAIISNWDSRLFKLCESLEIHPYFDFILASAVFGAAKPSGRIFQEALKKSGAKPEDAVHIGDSLEDDIQGAHRAGLSAILVDRTAKTRSLENSQYKQVKIIRDLKELIA